MLDPVIRVGGTMFNVLEETTVKARQRHARTMIGMFVGVVASGAFATVNAQTQTLQRGQTAGPRFMVPTFRSSERGLGLQAAEAVRERMGQDFQLKTLWIVPKSDIMTTLVNSGYSTTEALSSNDARALAQLLRAEEYVEGMVEKIPGGISRLGEHDAHSPRRHGAAAPAGRSREAA